MCKCMLAHEECAASLQSHLKKCSVCSGMVKLGTERTCGKRKRTSSEPAAAATERGGSKPLMQQEKVLVAIQRQQQRVSMLHSKYAWVSRIMPAFCNCWRQELVARGETVWDISNYDCTSVVLSIVFGDRHFDDLQEIAGDLSVPFNLEDCKLLEDFALSLTLDWGASEERLELENYFSSAFRTCMTQCMRTINHK